ncbi:hypothetical protein EMCRGX_G032210 [Ephydatia muelleri]|eukprot:Em0019g646a
MVGSVLPLLAIASLVGIAYGQCNSTAPTTFCSGVACNTTDTAGVCMDQCCFVPLAGQCCTSTQNEFLKGVVIGVPVAVGFALLFVCFVIALCCCCFCCC